MENTSATGPSSLDSEYDEYLGIPDIGDSTLDPFTINSPACNYEAGDLPIGSRALPFKTVHHPPVRFKSPHRSIFIPNEEIELQFTEHERNVTTHLLNPNLYTIELRHGDFSWTLKKRYKHIQFLHQQLRLFRASLNIPFPTKTHRERRESFKHVATHDKTKSTSGSLPRFPSKPDALVPDDQIETRMRQLEEYLRNLLKIPLYRNHHETACFLEVSHLSFVHGLGLKGKEGEIRKRTRSAQPGARGCNCCGLFNNGICVRCNYVCSDICGSWRNRWLIVKDSFIAYLRPRDGSVKCVILYDTNFEVSSGIFSTGLRRGLHIINLSRHIVIKCPTRRTTQEWMSYIKEVAHNSDFIRTNRYHSFAPYRTETIASWFVDGSDYMSAVADALERAREEIYIADWWLSPEIYMKRPAIEGDYWRLNKILQRKASQGVKVFVLLYKEVELALGINSYYSKQQIVSCHPQNIKILRHPDHAKAGIFLWAHHEKIVVVDQSIAFLGGIDLCYGRWDTHEHRLTDLGSVSSGQSKGLKYRISTSSHQYKTTAPALMQLAKVTNSLGTGLATSTPSPDESSETQREIILTTDIDEVDVNASNGNLVIQPSPENMKANTPELERKNILDRIKDNMTSFLSFESDSEEEEKEAKMEDKADETQETPALPTIFSGNQNIFFKESRAVTDEVDDSGIGSVQGLFGNAKYWVGKDYTNFIVKDFNNLDRPYQDLVDRGQTPRMPWHDVGGVVQGAAARDVARHFIMRWNAVKLEKAKLNPLYPYLLPKTYRDVELESIMPLKDVKPYRVKAQIVRSVSHWSAGFMDQDTWESSIHEAYVDVISKAKRYIYIENQFFISLASLQVRNQIGDALFKRILRAYRESALFRVFVVMPLLPGFEGEVGSPSGSALHAITHWNYASICRGKDSLMVRLKQAGIPDPTEYITFHGLRTHSELNGDLVTELIYVHSKLLIADDLTVICGSANINDRSLLGSRDSEIAVVIQDEEFEEIDVGDQRVRVGFYCGELRKRLFQEHLGLPIGTSGVEISDPVSAQFYHNVWQATALSNTDIFEKVFNCIPSDQVTDFQTLRLYQDKMPLHCADPTLAAKLLQDVKGHLVMLPLNFLRDEVLTPNPSSVNGMMPTTLWT